MSDTMKYTVEVYNNTLTLPSEVAEHLRLPSRVCKIDFIIDEETGCLSVERSNRLAEIKSQCNDAITNILNYQNDISVLVCDTESVIAASNPEFLGYISMRFGEELDYISSSRCYSPRCYQTVEIQSVFGNSFLQPVSSIFPIVDNNVLVGSIVVLGKLVDTGELYDKLFEQSKYLSEEVSKLSRIVI